MNKTETNGCCVRKWTPDDIICIARSNVVVDRLFCAWRKGFLTWEQSLIACVSELARQNDSLLQHATLTALATKRVVVSSDNGNEAGVATNQRGT